MAWLLLATSCVTRQVPVVETYSETEYKTEYKTETYTETVDAVIDSREGRTFLNPKVKWYTDIVFPGLEGSGGTYYYGYQIEPSGHSKIQVEIRISQGAQQQSGLIRVYDLTGIGQLPPRPTPLKSWYVGLSPEEANWLNSINVMLNSVRVLGEVRTGVGMVDNIVFDATGVMEFGILSTTWNYYSITSVRLNWTDETMGKKTVTGERQVPYQVPYQVEKQRTVYKTETVPFWDAIFGR
jgi:hypothetical protein